MEAIRKQASKLREQVAKQQQALLKQLSVHYASDSPISDESDIQCRNQLKKLCTSTRSAEHFQKNLVRGVEGFISAGTKEMEIAMKLANDCCRYRNEQIGGETVLPKFAVQFGNSHILMEKEKGDLNTLLSSQATDTLRSMIGDPLEDARHLTHRYERIWREVEAQVSEVIKRKMKVKKGGGHADSSIKVQAAESKLSNLKLSLAALGREATSAMMSVEAQQQEATYKELLAMVEAERSYHKSVMGILATLYSEITEKQPLDTSITTDTTNLCVSSVEEASSSNKPADLGVTADKDLHSVAKVIHSFDAQVDGELSLSVGEYAVVRQIARNGWSEGQCGGNSGWFPSAYVEQEDKASKSKFDEDRS